MAIGRSEAEIFKPRNDKREYRRVVLPNSLEVLLISDPDTDKAAASMDVSVGYFCDPDGLEGLAHFLEHMLFYASEKYPMENSYSKYISEHGGSTNAFTASEHTNFHFDVNADCLEEALDSSFSENQKNLLSDAWRMSQLQKHLTSKDHPYHKFGTGNWDTLEVKPKSRGVDTRIELIKFYEETYSANLMHLVLYGREGLDYLQSLVERIFGDIRNIGRDYVHFLGQPCSSEHLQVILSGLNDKMKILLHVVIDKIRQFEVKPDRFSVIKESVMKNFQNFKFQKPCQQAEYYCSLLLKDHAWYLSEKLEVLPHLEASDLTEFSSQLLEKTFLECYVGGNIQPNEAESMIQHIEKRLFKDPLSRPLFPSEYLAKRIVKLEMGIEYYYPIGVLNQ